MFADEGLPEELTAFEAQLASLRPVVSHINRDRLMYRLGVQSALGRLAADGSGSAALASPAWWQHPHLWQAAALVLACTSLALGSLWIASPRTIDRVVYLPRPAASPHNAHAKGAPLDRIVETRVNEQRRPAIVAASRSQLQPNERWLNAMAAPGFDYPQSAELRARVPRVASDPGAPIIVADQRYPAAPVGPAEDRPSVPPLRWSDHRQWIDELLNPASH